MASERCPACSYDDRHSTECMCICHVREIAALRAEVVALREKLAAAESCAEGNNALLAIEIAERRAEVERLKEELNDTNDLLESEYDSAARIRKEELECTDPDCERTKVEGPSHWWGDFGCTKGREQEKARADAAERERDDLDSAAADTITREYEKRAKAEKQREAAEAERDRLRKLLSLDPNGAELARIYDGWTDALAERDRLAEALREIQDEAIRRDTRLPLAEDATRSCVRIDAIAAAALKREEKP